MFGGKEKEAAQQQDNRASDTRSKPFTISQQKKNRLNGLAPGF